MIVAHYTHSVVFGSFLEKLLSFQYTENEQPPTLYSFAAFAMHRYTSFLTFFLCFTIGGFPFSLSTDMYSVSVMFRLPNYGLKFNSHKNIVIWPMFNRIKYSFRINQVDHNPYPVIAQCYRSTKKRHLRPIFMI